MAMTEWAGLTAAFLAVRAPLHAALSPDGRCLAVTTTSVPLGLDHEEIGLTLLDLQSGVESPVDGLAPGARLAGWSPAGDLAVVTEGDGQPVVAVRRAGSDAWATLAGTEGAVGAPLFSPCGRYLAVACRPSPPVEPGRPLRWSGAVLDADGIGRLTDPPALRLVDLDRGSVGTPGGRHPAMAGWRCGAIRWSPDGSVLAVVVSHEPTGLVGGQSLRLVGVDGSVGVPALPGGRTVAPAWLDDGRLAVLIAEPTDAPAGSAARLYVASGSGFDLLAVTDLFGDVYGDQPAELADSYDGVILGAPGGRLVVRTGHRGCHGIAVVDPAGGPPAEIVGGRRCASPVAVAGERLVFTSMSASAMVELHVAELPTGRGERPLTAYAARAPRPAAVTRWCVGRLDGWMVHPPADHRRAGPPPAVVVVHGGPHYAYGEAFSIDAQVLAAAGFAVLYTNPRGSTGYGEEFAHRVHGDWPGALADVLAVIDDAVGAGWIDGARLGIAGNSYGGYLACWAAATTERFRAAVAENPVTDLVSMYGTSDIGPTFLPRQFGGAPHEQWERYVAQSPIRHAHRARTPTLFVSGTDDRRCPPGQAWAMHRGLLAAGTPSEVLVLPGSAHEGSTYGPPACRVAHDQAVVAWMRRWLVG